MSATWILTVALMGPPPDVEVAENTTIKRFELPSGKTVEAKTEDDLNPNEIRELYRRALQRASKRANAKPEDVVMDLVKVYGHLGRATGIAHSEVTRMRSVVKARLEKLRGRLFRDNLRRKKEMARERRRSRGRQDGAVSNRPLSLAGASEIQCANELIELIQTMIEPESWEVNGGIGSIRYFPLLKVLVIRQTRKVHEQIGGAFGAFR